MKHRHHIIPKHMGGSDDSSNLIDLTIEEHADAHRVLWEHYGKQEDLLAWKSLSAQIGKEEIQKIRASIGGKNNKGKQKTEEHKLNTSNSLIGKVLSEDHKKKISQSMTGNNNFKKGWNEERRNKFSNRMKQSHKENPRILEKDDKGRIVSTKSTMAKQKDPLDLKPEGQ